ncbi:MAG: DUF3784 domain-containing protein [Clostridia bacterium]|nr:DUF3784 domain-containing protein [Clostridia bacterium]
MFTIFFDLGMAAIMFIVGILFCKSNGKAAGCLSGYHMKTAREREKHDEQQMCRDYGKRMMMMAAPFLAGAAIDVWFSGIGCMVAWGIWAVMFILLLIERAKRER